MSRVNGPTWFTRQTAWALPTNVPEFLVWLREAMPEGTDVARLEAFMRMPAAENMPRSLRMTVEAIISGQDAEPAT